MGRGSEGLFETGGANQGCRAVVFVHFAHFFGDVDETVGLVHFLAAELFGEDGVEVFGLEGLTGGRVEGWHGLVGHVGLNVVPLSWNLVFGEEVTLCLFAHDFLNFMMLNRVMTCLISIRKKYFYK